MLLSLHCIVPAAFLLHSFAEHCVDLSDMVISKVSGSFLSLCELLCVLPVSARVNLVSFGFFISPISLYTKMNWLLKISQMCVYSSGCTVLESNLWGFPALTSVPGIRS